MYTRTMQLKWFTYRNASELTYLASYLEQLPATIMEAGTVQYYKFENMCHLSTGKDGYYQSNSVSCIDAQALLYGIEVWGGNTFATSWNEIENTKEIPMPSIKG